MPGNIKELIIILILSAVVFLFAHRPACSITTTKDFIRKRNLWFMLTIVAFLAPSYWLYIVLAIPLVIIANKQESNPVALFFLALFALPVMPANIPGMGIINFLFELTHIRLLALLILLPAFFSLKQQENNIPFGRAVPDKLLIFYILLESVLFFRETTFTDALRQIFYLFIDVFLPYYVVSRSLKSMQAFRGALLSFVLGVMILALVASFEISTSWPLYGKMQHGFIENRLSPFLMRDGMVRALATAGQPIPLGYTVAVGLGLYLFVQRSIQNKYIRHLGFMLLIFGLIAPLSRGPWIGAIVLMVIFIATGHNPAPRLAIMSLASVLIFLFLLALPGGERIINLLPYVGITEKSTIDAREILLANSIIVIQRNFWLGSANFIEAPEMQELAPLGGGFVDIVNTYVGIALSDGVIGLTLFVLFFILVLIGIYNSMSLISERGSEEFLLGRALLSTLLAIMTIIATVSSITFIPIVYWSVAGLGVAYAQMILDRAIQNKGSS